MVSFPTVKNTSLKISLPLFKSFIMYLSRYLEAKFILSLKDTSSKSVLSNLKCSTTLLKLIL